MQGAVKPPPGPTDQPRAHRWQMLGFGLAVVVVLGAMGVVVLGPTVGGWFQPGAEATWTSAREAFEARDFPRADAALRRLATLRAPTPLDWMLRAQVAIGLGRIDEALADLKHVPDDHPMAAAAQLELGQMELRRHRFVPAEAHFLKALELDSTKVQARRELVYIYGTQLRRPELNANFRKLAELAPLTFSEVFLWCLARGVTWEPEEIVKTLGQAIAADPTDHWARLGQATSFVGLHRYAEAEAVLAPLPESDADARAIRVRIALDRGEDELAESLLAGGPDDHAGLALLRGQLALARGDAKETLHHFRIAYQNAPFSREAVFGYGKALQLNNDPAAATYLDQALKLDLLGTLMQKASVQANRKDPQLIRDLGAACASVGRFPEARAWYNIAIAQDPLDTKANAALARLESAERGTAPDTQ